MTRLPCHTSLHGAALFVLAFGLISCDSNETPSAERNPNLALARLGAWMSQPTPRRLLPLDCRDRIFNAYRLHKARDFIGAQRAWRSLAADLEGVTVRREGQTHSLSTIASRYPGAYDRLFAIEGHDMSHDQFLAALFRWTHRGLRIAVISSRTPSANTRERSN